jgi:putative hydrolase of the HAD superfamily
MARAVLLDALGTLLDLEPPAPKLVRELAARGAAVSEDEASAAIRAEIAFYREHHDMAKDAESLARLRARCTEVLREALPPRARGVEDLRGALLASLRFRAFDDAAPALAALRADGVRLIVVSNWDVSLHEALADTGLAPLLDGAISSAEAGARKPDPAIFEQALALAGARAGEAVHVGDTPEADVEGALVAGIEPVLIRRDGSAGPEGVRTIASLGSLIAH